MRAPAPEEFLAREQMRRDDGGCLRIHRSLDDAGGAQPGDSIGRVAEVLAQDLVGMLAKQRSGAVDLAGSRGKFRQDSGLLYAAPLRMKQIGGQLVRDDLPTLEQVRG